MLALQVGGRRKIEGKSAASGKERAKFRKVVGVRGGIRNVGRCEVIGGTFWLV